MAGRHPTRYLCLQSAHLKPPPLYSYTIFPIITADHILTPNL